MALFLVFKRHFGSFSISDSWLRLHYIPVVPCSTRVYHRLYCTYFIAFGLKWSSPRPWARSVSHKCPMLGNCIHLIYNEFSFKHQIPMKLYHFNGDSGELCSLCIPFPTAGIHFELGIGLLLVWRRFVDLWLRILARWQKYGQPTKHRSVLTVAVTLSFDVSCFWCAKWKTRKKIINGWACGYDVILERCNSNIRRLLLTSFVLAHCHSSIPLR